MLDVISDILTRLSVQGTLYFRTSFTAPYGVKVPPFENVARFHFAHRGSCQVEIDGHPEPLTLQEGDLVIVPHGASHCLLSPDIAGEAALPLDTVLEKAGYKGDGVLFFGGDEASHETELICGHFSFASGGRHILFDALPAYIHVPDYGETAGPWLAETLKVLGAETEQSRAGSELLALRLSETILAHAIRFHLEQCQAQVGLVNGFADPQLGRAIAAVHAQPVHDWTVDKLAKEAGMSRSSFADRFRTTLGTTPMTYIKQWRLQLARDGLAERGLTIAEAAELAGYKSEAAFSRAFKSETGEAPSAYRARRRDP